MPKKKSKGKGKPAEAFTATLRRRLAETMQAEGLTSYRAAASAIGVSHASLWRFAIGGTPSGPLVDKLAEWLGQEERS